MRLNNQVFCLSPYPQRLAVLPDVAASRSVLIPVQAPVVEIFLFPAGARGGNASRSSTKGLIAMTPRGKPLRVKQERAGEPTVLSRPRSPRLADHPRRNWPQDPLHHGQVLPVVVRLRERNVKGRHGTDCSCSTSSPFYLRTPRWATPRSSLQDCGAGGKPISPRGSWLCWGTASILFQHLGGSHAAHSSHLKQGETHIILKDDAADAPHITGLAPAKL